MSKMRPCRRCLPQFLGCGVAGGAPAQDDKEPGISLIVAFDHGRSHSSGGFFRQDQNDPVSLHFGLKSRHGVQGGGINHPAGLDMKTGLVPGAGDMHAAQDPFRQGAAIMRTLAPNGKKSSFETGQQNFQAVSNLDLFDSPSCKSLTLAIMISLAMRVSLRSVPLAEKAIILSIPGSFTRRREPWRFSQSRRRLTLSVIWKRGFFPPTVSPLSESSFTGFMWWLCLSFIVINHRIVLCPVKGVCALWTGGSFLTHLNRTVQHGHRLPGDGDFFAGNMGIQGFSRRVN